MTSLNSFTVKLNLLFKVFLAPELSNLSPMFNCKNGLINVKNVLHRFQRISGIFATSKLMRFENFVSLNSTNRKTSKNLFEIDGGLRRWRFFFYCYFCNLESILLNYCLSLLFDSLISLSI